MIKDSRSLSIKLQRTGSFFLILLFLFISAAQVLHTHLDSENYHDKPYGDREQLQLIDKCSVCDYYHHTQGKQIFSHYPPILLSAHPKVITINTLVFTGNYKFELQGYTNKGPPDAV
ncbi:hypothetical protein [Pedobacter heparinus]|uniref:hypothetical protein n=1 Tax=Pedobacter heparinus TaxID=984 RepID=UPI00292ED21A|nr:hypothetical protein [Pedobacter heparinus]